MRLTTNSEVDRLLAVNSENIDNLVVGYPVGQKDESQDYFLMNHVSFLITTSESLSEDRKTQKTKNRIGEKYRVLQVEANPKRYEPTG